MSDKCAVCGSPAAGPAFSPLTANEYPSCLDCFRLGAVPEHDLALAYDRMTGFAQPDWLPQVQTMHKGGRINWAGWLAATGRPPIG